MTMAYRVARRANAVTPNDNTDIAGGPAVALYVGGAGDVVVRPVGQNTSVTFVGVVAGSVLPVAVSRVLSTGTTATDIVALHGEYWR